MTTEQQPSQYQTMADRVRNGAREGVVILLLALCSFLILALASFHPDDGGWFSSQLNAVPENLMGRFGAYVSDILLAAFGYTAYLIPLVIIGYVLHRLYYGRQPFDRTALMLRLLGGCLWLSANATLAALHFYSPDTLLPNATGGVIGESLAQLFLSGFGLMGSTLLMLAVWMIGFSLLTGLSWLQITDVTGYYAEAGALKVFEWLRQEARDSSRGLPEQYSVPVSHQRKEASDEQDTTFYPQGSADYQETTAEAEVPLSWQEKLKRQLRFAARQLPTLPPLLTRRAVEPTVRTHNERIEPGLSLDHPVLSEEPEPPLGLKPDTESFVPVSQDTDLNAGDDTDDISPALRQAFAVSENVTPLDHPQPSVSDQDDEVPRVVENRKFRDTPDYADNIPNGWEENDVSSEGGGTASGDDDKDALYDDVVDFITETRRVSASGIQRRFNIGYNRADRIVESLEAAGVVSPMGSNGRREVLVPPPATD